jgi:hypothetical protein
MKNLSISLIGLLILSLGVYSCTKLETAQNELSENIWHKKEYKAFFDGKEYNLKLEYQEVGRGIKFDKNTPKEIIDFFKTNDSTLVAHVINEEVHYYSSLDAFKKNTIFGDSIFDKKYLKYYNGGRGIFYQNPISVNNGGTTQIDEIKTMGFITAPYAQTNSTYYTLSGLYNGTQSQTFTLGTPMLIYDWHGKNPWVGTSFNDQTTVVGADHYIKTQPVHVVCFQHANYGGYRLVVSKSSTSNSNNTDLRGIVMCYGVFSSTSWNDEISSHYTVQCPAWVMGSGHTVQI